MCIKSLSMIDQGGKSGTKLSTIQPYTTMESSVYATFSKAYIKAATFMNMTRVAAVAPFGLCFSSNLGPLVPEIDRSKLIDSCPNLNTGIRVSEFLFVLSLFGQLT